MIVSHNYHHITDASVGTNVEYMSSHLCLLQLHSSASRPIMYVADNAWLLSRNRLVRNNFCQSFSKHFHSIRVANIKWLYILNTLEAYFNSGFEVSPTVQDTSALVPNCPTSAPAQNVRHFGTKHIVPKCLRSEVSVHHGFLLWG